MTVNDYFALLSQPRLPWLDADQLKSSFIALSSAVHPDHVHGASENEKLAANHRFVELNTAYKCLSDPKERLLHLLELERGTKPSDIQRTSSETLDLFIKVGQVCRDADDFLVERAKATSPLLKVRLLEEGMEWIDRLDDAQKQVTEVNDALISELRTMNAVFQAAPPVGSRARLEKLPLDRLEEIYRVLSYVSRWRQQIGERIVQLST